MTVTYPNYALEVEFVTGSYTNITDDCERVSIDRRASTLGRPLSVGVMDIALNNSNGKYSPSNSASAFYSYLKPNKKIRLRATFSGTTYPVFAGTIKQFTVQPILGPRTVTLRAQDQIARLKDNNINIPLYTDTNPASLFTAIMSECNVASFGTDTFYDDIPFAWFQNRQANSAIQEILESGYYWAANGPCEQLFFHNRYFNVLGTVTASFDNTGFGLTYALDDRNIANISHVVAQPRIISTNVRTVAYLEPSAITVPASSHVNFWLNYFDPDNKQENTPATDLITPVVSLDYRLNTASGDSGTDLTLTASLDISFFGATAICSLFNGSDSTAYVTTFNVRGKPIQRIPTFTTYSSVNSSITEYGERDITLTSNLIKNKNFAQDYAEFLTAEFHDPKPDMTISHKNIFPEQLSIDLGNLIHIRENNTGVNNKFTVLGISHVINLKNGIEHVTNYTIDLWKDYDWFILDTSQLDNQRLAF